MTKSATRITPLQKLTTRGIQLLVLLLLILPFGKASAQVTYNESFDIVGPYPQNSLPNGWAQGKFGAGVDADNYWDRMGATSFLNGAAGQFVNPRTGTAMLRYRSDLTNSGEAAFVASKRLDMRGYSGTPTVSFWMYRDETTVGFNDNVRVYANFTPDMNGAPVQLTASPINRPCGSAPGAPCPVSYSALGWQQYTFNIPAAFNTNSVYIVLLGTSALGANMFVDDFSVQTWPLAQNYVASSLNVVNQNSASTAQSQISQQIIGIRLTMDGVTTPRVLTQFVINTNGTTNATTDLVNAKLWYTGGTNSFNLTTATLVATNTIVNLTNISFLIPPTGGYTGPTSMNNMEHGDNYFWITYDIAPGATSGNFVDAELVSLTISGSGVVSPTVATLPGSREIDVVYCIPNMTVGTAWLNYVTNDYIANVTMAGNPTAPPGINNSLNSTGPNAGGCAGGPCPFSVHPPDYELFAPVPGKTAALTADGTTNYPISLKVGTYCCSNYIAAWIDFNKNGSFLDPGEKIAQSGSLSNGQVYNAVFTVPVTATTGTTRMRVREVWITPNIDPCNQYTYGETEDYVVTILPTCGVPGWKTWLGFTDDWDNPANWCGGVPTINDNARLPGSGGTPYYRPVIKPGVFATTKKLRVEANDTLYIRSWNNSSLTVSDSMYIQHPTSMVKVVSTLVDTAQVSNGTLIPNTSLTPLKNATKSRNFFLYTQAELLSKGLVANDVITEITLHIQRVNTNTNPYRNLTIKYYYTNPAFVFTVGLAATVPPQLTAPVTVFSADVPVNAVIPAAGGWGTLTFPSIPGAFVWNGSANKLVVELCYDNTGFGNTAQSDQPRYTQTLGFRNYATLLNISANTVIGCDMKPPFQTPAVGGAGVTVVNVGSAAIAANLTVGSSVTGTGYAANTTIISIVGTAVTLSAATTGVVGTTTFGQTSIFYTPSDFRPNLTFKYDRPFSRYPIEVRGHWGNNGTFIPSLSKVTLKGTAVQNVAGTSNTTFFDLGIDNNNHVVRQTDFTVTDTLMLTNGRLKLNLGQVNLTNPLIAALTRTNGFIQSETDLIATNVAPFGRFHWNMGATPGLRVIPFIKATGAYIPMDYNIDSGTHDVVLATHATLANNTNIPPSITNINGYFSGTDNSNSMVDRFYMVDNTAGTTPQADITFRYAISERAALGNTSIKAQRWLSPTTEWEYPFIPTQAYVTDVVSVTDFTAFNSNVWWALVNETSPLPVELLDFTAKPENDKVKLTWVTASEVNNSHYVVERSVDQSSFDYISRVESRGPSSSTLEYYTWDNSPLDGKQFYYLRQHDYDGKVRTYGPVAVEFSKDVFDILTATTTSSELGVTVVFNYNSNEPYKYSIVDMTGRTIVSKDNNPAEPGANVIDIEAALSKGVYQIVLQNSSKVVTKKFFY